MTPVARQSQSSTRKGLPILRALETVGMEVMALSSLMDFRGVPGVQDFAPRLTS